MLLCNAQVIDRDGEFEIELVDWAVDLDGDIGSAPLSFPGFVDSRSGGVDCAMLVCDIGQWYDLFFCSTYRIFHNLNSVV